MKKIFNLRLPLMLFSALACGILFLGCVKTENIVIGVAFITVFVLCVSAYFIFFLKNKKGVKHGLAFGLCFIVAFVLGVVGISVTLNNFKKADLYAHTYTVEGRVNSISFTDNGIRAVITNGKLNSNEKAISYKIVLYVNGCESSFLEYGDIVKFTATLTDSSYVSNGKISGYGLAQKLKYSAYIDKSELVVLSHSPTLFQKINIFMRDSLKNGLDDNEFSVAYAMLLGHDEFIDENVITDFRHAGVAHIFAVSGLHVGFLATVLTRLLRRIRANKSVSVILTVLTLFFYSGVCGFTASSVRASIMYSVYLVCKSSGFKYDGLSSLGIAGFIILFISPSEVFCAGFQLSFLVVFGMLTLVKPLKKAFAFLPEKIATALASVVSAQAVGLPACLWCFGEASVFSVVANLVFIPVAGIIYEVTLICCLSGGIFNISFYTLFLIKYVFKCVIYVIGLIDYGVFIIKGVRFWLFAFSYYAFILVFAGLIRFKKIARIFVCLSLVLITVSGAFGYGYYCKQSSKVRFIGSNSLCCAYFSVKNENVLVVGHIERYASLSRLNTLLNNENVSSINCLILIGDDTDLNLAVTKINYLSSVENVYYTGSEKRLNEEITLLQSFKDYEVNYLRENDCVSSGEISVCSVAEGNAVKVNLKSTDYIVFGCLQDRLPENLPDKADVIVAYNLTDMVFAKYKSAYNVSFLSSYAYPDAQTEGIFYYKPKKISKK